MIATGEQHSVRDFVDAAANELGFAIEWQGGGTEETGTVSRVLRSQFPALKPGKIVVRVDPRYFRPTEVDTLLGDARKAQEKLGWTPRVRFPELVAEMMREDLKAAERDDLVRRHGYSSFDHHE